MNSSLRSLMSYKIVSCPDFDLEQYHPVKLTILLSFVVIKDSILRGSVAVTRWPHKP